MANLRGANLRGAFLSMADLRGANLREAHLSGAVLSRADLRGANLFRADLSEARFIDTNLGKANFSGADLRGAFLSMADLREADRGSYQLAYDSQRENKTDRMHRRAQKIHRKLGGERTSAFEPFPAKPPRMWRRHIADFATNCRKSNSR
jgi:hypothetical protein